MQDHGRDLCGRGAPLSAASVRRTHVVVHAALEQAVAWEWIVTNPASKASPGRVDPAEIKRPTVDEVLTLFRGAEQEDLDFAVPHYGGGDRSVSPLCASYAGQASWETLSR